MGYMSRVRGRIGLEQVDRLEDAASKRRLFSAVLLLLGRWEEGVYWLGRGGNRLG